MALGCTGQVLPELHAAGQVDLKYWDRSQMEGIQYWCTLEDPAAVEENSALFLDSEMTF